jgi:hypothetical protein
MDIVKDVAAGGLLLAVEVNGGLSAALGDVPGLPYNLRQSGELLAWFVLFLVMRLRDHARVRRRVRAQVKAIKTVVPPSVPCLDAAPPPVILP